MSELDDFLADVIPRQIRAEKTLHDGDPEPRLAMWSTEDPVTILGALGVASIGREQVEDVSRWIATRFSNCTSYDFELVAAGVGGDLAYTVGYEISAFSLDGKPTQGRLRATHAYRLEDGEWKIVHRHGDSLGTGPVPKSDGG
jgi:ketosteroid isomerase-like protein